MVVHSYKAQIDPAAPVTWQLAPKTAIWEVCAERGRVDRYREVGFRPLMHAQGPLVGATPTPVPCLRAVYGSLPPRKEPRRNRAPGCGRDSNVAAPPDGRHGAHSRQIGEDRLIE
jgi:hypothetical protein